MSHARKFRFGVLTRKNDVESATEWREFAKHVEDLGYSSLLVGDHFAQADNPPSMLALASAAESTSELRVGTLVLGNDYRHPAVVAKDAATLDRLSGGRLELGIGAGWMKEDYDALGFRYDPIGVRLTRLDEALAVIKSAWSGDPFDFSGDHYTIRGYRGLPKPAQEPHPPIMVGGGSPRILRMAGRHADVVGILQTAMGPDGPDLADLTADEQDARIRRKIEWVREGAGERFDEVELQMMYHAAITADPRAMAEGLATATGARVEEVLASGFLLAGTVDEVCATLEHRRDAWGVSYVVVFDDGCDDFAPVVARLAGT